MFTPEATVGVPAHKAAAHADVPHFVHVFPSFGWGGVPIRICNIINHFGDRYRHTILALDGNYDSGSRLSGAALVDIAPTGVAAATIVARISHCRASLKDLRPNLLLTYNWGSTEWAMANTLSPLCRHVHLESGFSVEEADKQLLRRVWFRRLALRNMDKLIVPSRTLVRLATEVWKLDPRRIVYIPNGVDCEKFACPPKPSAIPGFEKTGDEVIIGTVAPLRPEKNLSRLIRVFAKLATRNNARLLIIGDGSERDALQTLASRLKVADKVIYAGHIEHVEQVLGLIDIFALTSETEQMPNTVVQAMAAGRAIVSTDVGDVKAMLAPANRSFVAPKEDEAKFLALLEDLIGNPDTREKLGNENMAYARAHFSQEKMFRAYETVFEGFDGQD